MEKKLGDAEIMATRGQIERLMESTAWKDVEKELLAWRDAFKAELLELPEAAAREGLSGACFELHAGSLSGRIKFCEYVLGIPEMFLEIKAIEKGGDEPEDNDDLNPEEVS